MKAATTCLLAAPLLLLALSSLSTPAAGISTQALRFTGQPSGDVQPSCINSGGLFWPSTVDAVIEFWLKIEDPDQRTGIAIPLLSWDETGEIGSFAITVTDWATSSWSLTISQTGAGGGTTVLSSGVAAGCLDEWCYVSLRRDHDNTGEISLYVNNAEKVSELLTPNDWVIAGNVYFGGLDQNGDLDLPNGTSLYLDEFAVFGNTLVGNPDGTGVFRLNSPFPSALQLYFDFDGTDKTELIGGSTTLSCTLVDHVPSAIHQANANFTTVEVGPVVIPGEATSLSLRLFDRISQPVRVGGDDITMNLVHAASDTPVPVDSLVDFDNGTYLATFTPPLPGYYLINATLAGVPDESSYPTGGGLMHISYDDILVAANCSQGTLHVANNISLPCTSCPVDSWSDAVGFVSTCSECPANAWSAEQTALTQPQQCICLQGFYRLSLEDPCVVCPDGASCAGQLDDQDPVALPGFFQSPTDPNVFLQCPRPSSCLGGASSECAAGTDGLMCQDCAEGYYELSGVCAECPQQTVYIVGGMALFTLFMVMILLRFGSGVQKFGILSIGVNFLQVLAMFPVFQVAWPPSLLVLFNFLQPLLFNTDVFAAECTIDNVGHFDRVALQLVFPVLIAFVLVFMYACVWCGNKIYLKFEHGINVSKTGTLSTNPLEDLPAELSPRDEAGNLPPWLNQEAEPAKPSCWAAIGRATGILTAIRAKNAFRSKCYNAFAQFLLVAYPWLTRASIEIFACFEGEDGVRYMSSNASIVCGSDEWKAGLPVSLAGLGFYTIFLPGGLLLAMYINREDLSKTKWRFRVGTLYERFDVSFWAWEFVILMRKNALIVLIVFLANPGQELLQVYLGIVVLVLSLVLNMMYLPYWTPTLNNLESLTLLTASLCLATGIAYHTGWATGSLIGVMVVSLFVLVVGTLVALAYGSYGQWKTMEGRRPKEWADDMTLEDF